MFYHRINRPETSRILDVMEERGEKYETSNSTGKPSSNSSNFVETSLKMVQILNECPPSILRGYSMIRRQNKKLAVTNNCTHPYLKGLISSRQFTTLTSTNSQFMDRYGIPEVVINGQPLKWSPCACKTQFDIKGSVPKRILHKRAVPSALEENG